MWKKKIMTFLVSAGVLLTVPGAAFAAADPSLEQVKPTARQTTEVSQTSPKTGDLAMTQVGVGSHNTFGCRHGGAWTQTAEGTLAVYDRHSCTYFTMDG